MCYINVSALPGNATNTTTITEYITHFDLECVCISAAGTNTCP